MSQAENLPSRSLGVTGSNLTLNFAEIAVLVTSVVGIS